MPHVEGCSLHSVKTHFIVHTVAFYYGHYITFICEFVLDQIKPF